MNVTVQTVDRSGRDVHIFNREKKFGGREMGHRLLNKYLVLMDVGGAVYVLLELAWRGRSHWTMFVLGGLCFIGLGLINEVLPWDMPLWEQAAFGVLLITVLEFFTGCVVNLMRAGRCGTTAACRGTFWGRSASNTAPCGCP